MTCPEVLDWIRERGNPDDVAGMARYGINTAHAYGVRLWDLRAFAKGIGRDHALALELWDSGVHEAWLLASIIADPAQADEALLEAWVADFDSWDICDQVCGNLFALTPFAWAKAIEWAGREPEWTKRAGFALMADFAVHDKQADDARFIELLALCERECRDQRNFVKKAVNWALRNIGKRNAALNAAAVETAERIAAVDSKAARWIASDALRELRSDKVQARVRGERQPREAQRHRERPGK